MKAAPQRCDVAVIGCGPAASVAARRLALAGAVVVQIVGPGEPRDRPPEVVSPSARLLLRRLGLFAAADLGEDCSGVLSLWNTPQPDFMDFALAQGISARSAPRHALHAVLAQAACDAGAIQVAGRAVSAAEDGSVSWIAPDGAAHDVASALSLIACGRSGSLARAPAFQRDRIDTRVAFAAPWMRRAHADAIVLEAAKVGWWYAPPSASLVFVAEHCRRPPAQRSAWLRALYADTALLRQIGASSEFTNIRGMDAHSAVAARAIDGRRVLIGDAALALDPLSGSGIQHAIEGAEQASMELLASGRVGAAYAEWLASVAGKARQARRAFYGAAAPRFPGQGFWRAESDGVEGSANSAA